MKLPSKIENPANKEKNLFVERHIVNENDCYQFLCQQNCILFINTGNISISFSNIFDETMNSGQMIALSSGRLYTVYASEISIVTLFFFSSDVALPKLLSKDDFIEKNNIQDNAYLLKFDKRLNQFITDLYSDVENGIHYSDFLSAKTVELFYLLQVRYKKEELSLFFTPIFTNDQIFTTFIWTNYHKVKTIKEFASLSCYSVSGFEKRFKRVFGIAASHWLKEQKANDLLREMRSGNKPLKQIMFEYGFFSASHFNNFCKTRLGDTPGQLMRCRL